MIVLLTLASARPARFHCSNVRPAGGVHDVAVMVPAVREIVMMSLLLVTEISLLG